MIMTAYELQEKYMRDVPYDKRDDMDCWEGTDGLFKVMVWPLTINKQGDKDIVIEYKMHRVLQLLAYPIRIVWAIIRTVMYITKHHPIMPTENEARKIFHSLIWVNPDVKADGTLDVSGGENA